MSKFDKRGVIISVLNSDILMKGEMKMKDCIFCNIANGEIPSATLYEDEEFRVILDLAANKGHALILPKAHYENLYELPDELAAHAMVLAKRIITKMKEVVNCDGYNICRTTEKQQVRLYSTFICI